MPTLRAPPDHKAPEWSSRSLYHPTAVSTHIYVAILLLSLLVAVRSLVSRWRTPQHSGSGPGAQVKHKPGQHIPGPTSDQQRLRPGLKLESERQRPHADCGRQFQPLRASPGRFKPLNKVSVMDDTDSGLEEDHYPWSALAASRGVSTSDQNQQHDPSLTSSVTVTGGTSRSQRQRTSCTASSRRRQSGSSDGLDSQSPKGKGEAPMAGYGSPLGPSHAVELDGESRGLAAQLSESQLQPSVLSGAPYHVVDLTTVPRHFPRPPPPPPLTPPTLSTAVFPFEDRRPTYAASIPPALDLNFIHQPNPEYGADASSSATTSADVRSASPQSATDGVFPRRRSYTKSVPVGIPAARATPGSAATTTAAGTFSPSSYPPTSPLLPPPPPTSSSPSPAQQEQRSHPRRTPPSAPPSYEFVGGPGGPGIPLFEQWELSSGDASETATEGEISLQGEIISVVDGTGHGWTRHTRVYGGGVCLACLAASRRDSEGAVRGAGGGGFLWGSGAPGGSEVATVFEE